MVMDKDTHLHACAGALFQSPCGSFAQLLDWAKYRFTPIYSLVWSTKELRRAPDNSFAFTGSLPAMQKGIILALGMDFLYGIFGRFVSAPTALLFVAEC